MRHVHRIATTVYWLALVAWLASLVAAAATATSAFTALPELRVAVPSAAMVYSGADDASSRFAAGYVAQPVFAVANGIALFAMPVLAVCLLLQTKVFRWPARSWLDRLRLFVLVGAMVLTAIQLIFLAPRMNGALRDYRTAVLEGDAAAAVDHKARFDRDHVRVDPMVRTTALLLLAGLVLSAWTMTPKRGGERAERQAPRVYGRRP